MEDSGIIALYWQRSERAITETEKKYGAYCFTAADHILGNEEDAKECVNDTWLAAWNAIPPHRPSVLRAFLVKITRNIALTRLEKITALKRGEGKALSPFDELEECVGGGADVEEAVEARMLAETVRRFVRELPEREGNIFIRRYFFADPVSEIAGRYGLSGNNVTVILSRTRKKLKEKLKKEGLIGEYS